MREARKEYEVEHERMNRSRQREKGYREDARKGSVVNESVDVSPWRGSGRGLVLLLLLSLLLEQPMCYAPLLSRVVGTRYVQVLWGDAYEERERERERERYR